ncbi:unknown [Cryptophlebia leucotreta granulovirus]|uniref:Uncharacterized protein n=1 Tax=Cryptophlebia leucotreta granulosis virus TaxID=35254 RepID=Q7T5M9_GVCL|nr:hypothetical protein [Cryptophlebia leucotreta granulovirus]AAQ21655.1 unknown [Cryptophlebia leucotreta granulovirus]
MSSLKELYNEIIKTQQDIAITYGRVVGAENELKKKLDEDNKNNSIDDRLNELQHQLSSVLNLLKPKTEEKEKEEDQAIVDISDDEDEENEPTHIDDNDEIDESN